MARGFNYAPGASPELAVVRETEITRASIAVHGISKNPLVREVIAARPDCPFGLLVTLAHDVSASVRAAVAANPSAVPAVLEHLAKDSSEEVLLALVGNPSLTPDGVERLAMHKRPAVRAAAVTEVDARGPRPVLTGGARGDRERAPASNVLRMTGTEASGAMATVTGIRLASRGTESTWR